MRGMFRHLFQEVYKDPKATVVGVEVGVCYGLNAFQCLVCFPNLTMHLVDNYARHDSKIAKEAAEYIVAPFGDRAIFHYKDSVEAAKDFEDKSLDFVYIDAAHDYESVKVDIRAWFPKIKIGGTIGGHDFYIEDPKKPRVISNGVREAVGRLFIKTAYQRIAAADWWVDNDNVTLKK